MQEVRSKTYSVFDALEIVLHKKSTMAIYRLPGESDVNLVVQKNHELKELNDLSQIPATGGFLIAPFWTGDNNKTFLIEPEFLCCNTLSDAQFDSINKIKPVFRNGIPKIDLIETNKADFIDQLERTIENIKSGEFNKVVLSRVKIIEGKYSPHLVSIFKLLCESYPNAFVYLFHVKGKCWVGATPEPLICAANDQIYTVSLAGTRSYSEENTHVAKWNHKERLEQEYVTEYIEKILAENHISRYIKKGPYTKKAGKLLHLRTDFFFSAEEAGNKLPALINTLHPTSAICGIPMEKSLNFIKSLEKHDREYYTGFLGPVGLKEGMQLFVNLRCMQVLENQLALYVGGGITAESVPEDEWEETEIKAETLLSILQQI